MKQYTISYTESASRDIRGIFEYIAFSLKETQIAQKTVGSIQKEILALKQLPLRNPIYENSQYSLHTCLSGNYVIFYNVDEDLSQVWIIRVIYGGRDFDEQF